MPFGTANNKLRKALLFDYAKRCDEDICFRCGLQIEVIEDFSIEHKNAWSKAENPVEAFFDLNNIAFSHLSCNTGAANSERRVYETPAEKSREKNRKKYGDPKRYAYHLKYKREWYRTRKD